MKKLSFILGAAILSLSVIGCGGSKSIVSSKKVFVYVDERATTEDPNNPGVFVPSPDSVFVNIDVNKKGEIITKMSNE